MKNFKLIVSTHGGKSFYQVDQNSRSITVSKYVLEKSGDDLVYTGGWIFKPKSVQEAIREVIDAVSKEKSLTVSFMDTNRLPTDGRNGYVRYEVIPECHALLNEVFSKFDGAKQVSGKSTKEVMQKLVENLLQPQNLKN